MASEEEAAQAADQLERALLRATQVVERELARIVKAGEDDLDRLARRIAETLAQLAIDSAIGGQTPADASTQESSLTSLNGLAAALAKAAQRGMRFT